MRRCAPTVSGLPRSGSRERNASKQRRSGEHGEQGSATGDADSFYKKTVWQRMAIVFAGPFANFVFAVVVFAGLFSVMGEPHLPADIGEVMKGSAAERAGLKADFSVQEAEPPARSGPDRL